MHELRLYRNDMKKLGFKSFIISYFETDIWISVKSDEYKKEMEEFAYERVKALRGILENFITTDTIFASTLVPYKVKDNAPEIAKTMAEVAEKAAVGPMATVAGTFSHLIGEEIKSKFNINEIILENGGDIYASSDTNIVISIFAGDSPFSSKLKLQVDKSYLPVGICTSSGTVGHSLSFGKADAVTVICKNTALADAYATSLCNKVKKEDDILTVINSTEAIDEIIGVVIVYKDKIGIRGDISIIK